MDKPAKNSRAPTACSPGDLSKATIKETTFENTKLNTVKLNWKEVYYTNCPLVSASNVDQELGWTKEEYKKIGKNFMLRHGYIKNDFDVQEWAAPEFLEQASKELLEAQWKKATTAK